MKAGQIVQLKTAARAAQHMSIPPEAEGTVICTYRLLQRFPRHPDRVDVDFKDYGVLWGEASDLFEVKSCGEAPKNA
ncbi:MULTISPECIES: hypothetical protein [unclassified Beijerinckia]|uniref:hypothetical protein n=1 Tax=unclassified Beijerinckia TaxID=2638183 RepID=UPI000898753A|nr:MULTISPECIES: hypothetical protein [unclassified Beijerinckia]MDH7797811.1 hypothetical protein [Beijerinckia sp. GAS462]SEC99363.1 hypothetical protein SAMN05443249_4102 [Beijerinckia sp. 28-YEA-48]